MNNNITTFIVDGEDYFAAHEADGAIRVGLKGVTAFSFPKSHPLHAKAAAIVTEEDAEDVHDEQFDRVMGTV